MSFPVYDSWNASCKTPFGAVRAGQSVTFTVNLPKTVPCDTVVLRVFKMDVWHEAVETEMYLCGTDVLTNSYRCTYKAQAPSLCAYYFEARAGDCATPVKRGGGSAGHIGDGDMWQLTVYDPRLRTPNCLREGVMYQIFPDRFYNSGQPKDNIPEDRTLRWDWDGLPEWRPNGHGEVTNSDYFCGDLNGIVEKLDYLAGLGVSVIYLNPVFEAHSNHRYNTADYRKVDPLLGTNEDLRILCDRARKRGISIVLDGVFSHTGSDSVYFNREGRYGKGGAFNDQSSPYHSWYRFINFPWEYESWWGFHTLPNVNETEPSYLNFICGKDGVLRYWLRLGVEGFRLDVADELPDEFLDRLRAGVKAEKPGAAVIGEVWEDASNKVAYGQRRRYLLGAQLDSVMNYPFKDALLHYVRYGGGAPFFACLMQILENYPPPVIAGLMNSLSTHDTPRAITALAGEELGDHDRAWQEAHHSLSPAQYQLGKRLFILASIIQFGLPGIPCVYYGDEAGLCGYKDPFNRTCYPWGQEDQELLSAFRILGSIRRRFPFSQASFNPIAFDDGLCAFAREHDDRSIIFAINRSEQARKLGLPGVLARNTLFFCGQYGNGMLGPRSGVIISC